MELVINETKTIGEIQKAFNKRFPYLKISFFKRPHAAGEASPISEMYHADELIKNIRHKDKNGIISIDGDMQVNQLEMLFQEVFGLSVQIFRKSGDKWLQTTTTDSWTLNQQNEKGKEMNSAVEPEQLEDYHEQP
ncbi:MAG: hypothetical protein ACK4IK_02730 [Bacteroidia bacterium]